MASIQEILKKYLNKSGSPDVNTYLANQLNANKVVSQAARSTFEPKSFRQEEPVQQNIQQLPQSQLEQVVTNIIPDLAAEYAAQQANPSTAINQPKVPMSQVQPTTQVKSIEQKINENPQLFSSDRVWAALREARGSDNIGEGFAAGYKESPTGIPNPNDVIDADPAKRQRAMDWYRDYLKSHPEIVNREEEKKASLSSATPYTGLLQEQLKNASPEKQLEIAKELESILGSRAKEAEAVRLKELELSSKKQAEDAKLALERDKINQTYEINKAKAEKAVAGKVLPAGVLTNLGDINNIEGLLDNTFTKFEELNQNHPDFFIPTIGGYNVQAQAALGNPDAKAYLSQVTLLKQIVGKALEGGVLRAEDTKKYNDILGSPGATLDQLKEVADGIKVATKAKFNELIRAYELGGYNVSGFTGQPNMNPVTTSEVNPNDINDNLQNLIDATNAVNNVWEF